MKKLAVVIIGLFIIPGLAWAYPTSLNVIPTADLLDPGSLRMEFEKDGYSRIFTSDSENYWLFQTAVGPRLEMGVDIYNAEETSYMTNAKYALVMESDRSPAVSFGALDIGEGGSPSYYLAAAKDFGRSRLHAGGIGDRHEEGRNPAERQKPWPVLGHRPAEILLYAGRVPGWREHARHSGRGRRQAGECGSGV